MPSALSPARLRLTFLVPVSVVPGEGDEFDAPSWERPAEDVSGLVAAFRDLATPRSGRFLLSGHDLALDGSLERESALQLLQVFPDRETGLPCLAAGVAASHFDWAGVVREVGHAMLDPHFLGTPEEAARVFTRAVRESALAAAAGFSGTPVPLLAVEKTEEGLVVSMPGIWLADDAQLEEMRRHLPARSWQDEGVAGGAGCLVLDAAEVEGRGLREAVAGVAMLAMVFGGATARAGDVKPAAVSSFSKLASFFGGDARRGEKLPVKTQKLVQDAPRIFREVLEAPANDLRVIVDIGGQRAYLVKDGRVAFDTPISSAAAGHRTPRGAFTITEKVRKGKISTIYKCPLPGWMRLGNTAIGMHQGELPGYPASHGCIRMPLESALFIFDQVKIGTPVEVVDSWSPGSAASARPDLVAQVP